jgi:hypothetical protein
VLSMATGYQHQLGRLAVTGILPGNDVTIASGIPGVIEMKTDRDLNPPRLMFCHHLGSCQTLTHRFSPPNLCRGRRRGTIDDVP